MAQNLSNIRSGGNIEPPRVLFYAENGFGKTTFAAQAPKPIIIQTEDGRGRLDFPRWFFAENRDVAQSYNELLDALKLLRDGEHDRKTVAIDTVDELERLIFKAVASDHGKKNIEEIGYAKGYTFALDRWAEVLSVLDELRSRRKMLVILLGHSLVKKHDAPDTDPYDRYRLDLHDKSAGIIRDWADCILFGKFKVLVRKAGESFGQSEFKPVDAAAQRAIYTEERPSHWGKNRYGLPYELPFPEGESFRVFQDAFTAAVKPKTKEANANGKDIASPTTDAAQAA
jgi:hypothetical protein